MKKPETAAARTRMKCPHCGWQYYPRDPLGQDEGLVPNHDFPKPCRSVCPGSGQAPRSLGDRRPLWKDEDSEEESRVFTNCNVCGIKLRTAEEDEMGM